MQHNDNKKLSLDRVIDSRIAAMLRDVETIEPGMILKYDATKQEAHVQVSILRKGQTGDYTEIIDCQDVTVVFEQTEGSISHPVLDSFPSPCLLFFTKSDLKIWKLSDGKKHVEPADTGMFEVSNSFCIPGGYTDQGAWGVDPSVQTMQVKQGKKQLIGVKGGVDVWDIMYRLADVISKIVVAYGDNPDLAKLAVIMQEIETVKV